MKKRKNRPNESEAILLNSSDSEPENIVTRNSGIRKPKATTAIPRMKVNKSENLKTSSTLFGNWKP